MSAFLFDAYVFFKLAGILWFFAACFMFLRRYPVSVGSRLFFVLFVVLSGFLSSKLWYLIQHLLGREPYYYEDMGLAWRDAGSVLYGWILGGSAATWAGAVILGLPARKLFDAFLPHMLVAQILNRLGCHLAGCCWGKGPCTLPWAVPSEFAGGIRVHPVQLYEGLYDLLLLVFLIVLTRQKARPGKVALVYFVGYAAGRFFLEFFRGDNLPVAGLTTPQWSSLIIIFVFLIFRGKISPRS